jgi:predicted transcriptional regulator
LFFSINDNLDVAVQLANKQEHNIQEELARAFNLDDIPTLWQMFRTDDIIEQEAHKMRLSQESKVVLKNMQTLLKNRIKASVKTSKGAIFYI